VARLPTPGGDTNAWGTILNDYLSQAHNTDGSLKSSAISGALSTGALSQTQVNNLTTDLAAKASATDLTNHINKFHQPFVTVPAAWGQWWKQARTEGGSRKVHVHIWSDSIGAQGQGASNARTTSMASLIQSTLQTNYGNGGTGFLSHEYSTKSGWTTDHGVGGTVALASGTATMAFSSISGSSLKIFYRVGVTGSFRWRIDGGSYTTVNTTSSGTEPGVVSISTTDTTHSVDIERLSGTVGVHGVYGERSAGIVMSRIGQSGRAAYHYALASFDRFSIGLTNGSATITSANAGLFNESMVNRYLSGLFVPLPSDAKITAVASPTSATINGNASGTGTYTVDLSLNPPSWSGISGATITDSVLPRADLVILMLGANDPANLDNTQAIWSEGASHILRAYNADTSKDFTPDLIVVIEHIGNWFDIGSRYHAFAAAMAAMAEGTGGALVDIWGIGRRSFKYWNDLGYFADVIHPSDSGHAAYAQPIIDLVTSSLL
jgi:hypothetical protein